MGWWLEPERGLPYAIPHSGSLKHAESLCMKRGWKLLSGGLYILGAREVTYKGAAAHPPSANERLDAAMSSSEFRPLLSVNAEDSEDEEAVQRRVAKQTADFEVHAGKRQRVSAFSAMLNSIAYSALVDSKFAASGSEDSKSAKEIAEQIYKQQAELLGVEGKKNVDAHVKEHMKNKLDTAKQVRNARAIVGQDNDRYLNGSVLTLWGSDEADRQPMFPSSVGHPSALGGGAMNGWQESSMRAVTKYMRKQAMERKKATEHEKKTVRAVVAFLMYHKDINTYLKQIPSLQSYEGDTMQWFEVFGRSDASTLYTDIRSYLLAMFFETSNVNFVDNQLAVALDGVDDDQSQGVLGVLRKAISSLSSLFASTKTTGTVGINMPPFQALQSWVDDLVENVRGIYSTSSVYDLELETQGDLKKVINRKKEDITDRSQGGINGTDIDNNEKLDAELKRIESSTDYLGRRVQKVTELRRSIEGHPSSISKSADFASAALLLGLVHTKEHHPESNSDYMLPLTDGDEIASCIAEYKSLRRLNLQSLGVWRKSIAPTSTEQNNDNEQTSDVQRNLVNVDYYAQTVVYEKLNGQNTVPQTKVIDTNDIVTLTPQIIENMTQAVEWHVEADGDQHSESLAALAVSNAIHDMVTKDTRYSEISRKALLASLSIWSIPYRAILATSQGRDFSRKALENISSRRTFKPIELEDSGATKKLGVVIPPRVHVDGLPTENCLRDALSDRLYIFRSNGVGQDASDKDGNSITTKPYVPFFELKDIPTTFKPSSSGSSSSSSTTGGLWSQYAQLVQRFEWLTPLELHNILVRSFAHDEFIKRTEVEIKAFERILDNLDKDRAATQMGDRAWQRGDLPDRAKRDAIWSDAIREQDISQDRLYVFFRQMAGEMHEKIENVLSLSNEAEDSNMRRRREERRKMIESHMKWQNSVMESMVTAILKDSKLRLDIRPDEEEGANPLEDLKTKPVIVNEDTWARMDRIASGQDGLPFFAQDAALRKEVQKLRDRPTTLQSMLSGIATVMNGQLKMALSATLDLQPSSSQASFEYLQNPHVSYVMRISDTACSAVRAAYWDFHREWKARHYYRSPPLAWHLMEGHDAEVRTCFARLCALRLTRAKYTSGPQSAFVSRDAQRENKLNLALTMHRLIQLTSAIEWSPTPHVYA